MKKLFNIFALFCLAVHAQPALQWQKTIGGNDMDILNAVCLGNAGQILLAGWSSSNVSGEKSENTRGENDFWLVSLNAAGQIQWQRTIGGSESDGLAAAAATEDGGWITGGISSSDISGEKTENSRGGGDYWIVKLDQNGNIQWQRTIGGNSLDILRSIATTADGGYIVAGSSYSGISGEKTEPSRGINPSLDYWILKLDATGAIQWQKTYGGDNYDEAWSVIQASDGGYLVGGYSASDANYDKTENGRGNADYWVLKLDASGAILWQRTLGGNENDHLQGIIEVNDGYVLGGYSFSEISGDKTGSLRGVADFWLIKLDYNGNILWQKTIGGEDGEYLYALQANDDGTLLAAGSSSSDISWEKTENSRGISDMWVLNLDSEGDINWQKTIGGSQADNVKSMLTLPTGQLLLAGNSRSPVSGEKTEGNRGESDYWLVRLAYGNLGVQENSVAHTLQVYPNPTGGQINIISKESLNEQDILLYDAAGREISFETSAGNQIHFAGAPGIYFLKISQQGKTITVKIVKDK